MSLESEVEFLSVLEPVMHCFLASRLLFRGQLLRRMPLPRAAVLGWSRGALKISPQPAEPRRVTLTLPSVSLLRGV